MDLSNAETAKNLESAFGGESMANRKYLFFAEVTKKLGLGDLSKLFRETANQETEHAFAHFRLLHPELVVTDPDALSDEEKKKIATRCLELAIEGETYEYTTMYPEFATQARIDRDEQAVSEFEEQEAESREHAGIFRKAASNFGLLVPIEHHHADQCVRDIVRCWHPIGGAAYAPKVRRQIAPAHLRSINLLIFMWVSCVFLAQWYMVQETL